MLRASSLASELMKKFFRSGVLKFTRPINIKHHNPILRLAIMISQGNGSILLNKAFIKGHYTLIWCHKHYLLVL